MSCSGCIFTIKNSLAEFEGIADVQVDVAAGTTAIVYDKAQQPDAGKMAAAITASGYPARVLRILSPEQVAQEARTVGQEGHRQFVMLIALVVTFLILIVL